MLSIDKSTVELEEGKYGGSAKADSLIRKMRAWRHELRGFGLI